MSGDILIIANPTAGSFNAKTLEIITERLRAAGRGVKLHLTQRAGEIGALCADATLSARVVAIAGGDGSINEAVSGFADRPDPPALAVIPFGTANVLAHELHLPFKGKAIADTILADNRAPLHCGLANGHPFVLMASCGFDAEVVHAVPLALKRRFGKLAYVLIALKLGLSKRRRPQLRIEADGETFTCKLAIVTNGRCYGGPFVICPEASVTEPGLHLVMLAKDDPLSSTMAGLSLLFGRLHRARGVQIRKADRISIKSTLPAPAQIDGDAFGATPLLVEAGVKSVLILVSAA